MPIEDSVYSLVVPTPSKGILEGLDPAALEYPLDHSPDIENIRTLNGLWQTRAGMALWLTAPTFPGTGAVNLLVNYYKSDATVYRLVAQGGTLYQMASGGSSFASVTGGTGLGTSPFNGAYNAAMLRDELYLTDRTSTHLFKYDQGSGGQLTTVVGPSAPGTAPTAKRRIFAVLEDWTANGLAARWGWTASSSSNFDVIAPVSADPDLPQPQAAGPYAGGDSNGNAQVVAVKAITSSAKNKNVSKNNTLVPYQLNSHWIAFWFESNSQNPIVSFEIGQNGAGEFSYPIQPPQVSQPYPFFIPVGVLPSISYMRFRCTRNPSSPPKHVWVGRILLPGYLSGIYQYLYTYYNPTTGQESAPSPATGNIDCSAVPVNFQSTDASVMEKSVELTMTSALPGGSTTKIRLYRSGGVPALTQDQRGNTVWVRLTTTGDINTTLSSSAAQGDSKIVVVTAKGAANLSAGDYIALDAGVVAKQEVVQVSSVTTGATDAIYLTTPGRQYSDLVVDGSVPTRISSASMPFQANSPGSGGDVGKIIVVPTLTPAGAFTPGRYKITSLTGNSANLVDEDTNVAKSPAATGTTGGAGTLQNGLNFAHSSGIAVTPGYVDNNADENLATNLALNQVVDIERHDPPKGIHWLAVAGDGRLWAARFYEPNVADPGYNTTQRKMRIAVSNKPTPDRPNDQEIMPHGVDPLTRGSLTQGFQFDVDGDAHGDEIMWAGFYHGLFTVMTRRAIYQVHASSQADWSPTAVVKIVAGIGCIAGETVQEIAGELFWVSDGPRVMRWSGRGEPEDISFLRLTTKFKNAPTGYIQQWFARGHADKNGIYYRLCIDPTLIQSYTDLVIDGSNNKKITSVTRAAVAGDVNKLFTVTGPAGFTAGIYQVASVSSGAWVVDRAIGTLGTTGGTADLHNGNSMWLDYNLVAGAWEPRVHYDSSGNSLPWASALVWDGPSDSRQLYGALAANGNGYQLETGITDAGSAIAIRAVTPKMRLKPLSAFNPKHHEEWVAKVERLFVRLIGVTDTVTLRLQLGGSEYLDATQWPATSGEPYTDYTINISNTTPADWQTKLRANPGLMRGRWVSLKITGNVSNSPGIRELQIDWADVRRFVLGS